MKRETHVRVLGVLLTVAGTALFGFSFWVMTWIYGLGQLWAYFGVLLAIFTVWAGFLLWISALRDRSFRSIVIACFGPW
jgi:hypothetical protein